MTISAFAAAKKVCELSDWTLSNLQLQKILYLAHMIYMGENDGEPLVDGHFQAWDYGPVHPAIYHKAKAFGRGHVKNVFHGAKDLPDSSREAALLKRAVDSLGKVSPSTLVSITHSSTGAWYKHYEPGCNRSIIPDHDIYQEYKARFGRDE
ncbi:hypothetical protein PC39_01155 [Salinisphaera sp. PC39]|uniref:Panacea domain-containing protein n=1 Tax=Salinisphaera sp. PC39 TaxID=1304156 RepID=UPI00333FF25B